MMQKKSNNVEDMIDNAFLSRYKVVDSVDDIVDDIVDDTVDDIKKVLTMFFK